MAKIRRRSSSGSTWINKKGGGASSKIIKERRDMNFSRFEGKGCFYSRESLMAAENGKVDATIGARGFEGHQKSKAPCSEEGVPGVKNVE